MSVPSDSQVPTTFEKFPQLTWEIRSKIWRLALPRIKPSLFYYRPMCWQLKYGSSNSDGFKDDGSDTVVLEFCHDSLGRIDYRVPMASANREARSIALEWARGWSMDVLRPHEDCDVGLRELVFRRPMNVKHDALYIDEEIVFDLLYEPERRLRDNRLSNARTVVKSDVKHLIMFHTALRRMHKDDDHVFLRLLDLFPSARFLYPFDEPRDWVVIRPGMAARKSVPTPETLQSWRYNWRLDNRQTFSPINGQGKFVCTPRLREVFPFEHELQFFQKFWTAWDPLTRAMHARPDLQKRSRFTILPIKVVSHPRFRLQPKATKQNDDDPDSDPDWADDSWHKTFNDYDNDDDEESVDDNTNEETDDDEDDESDLGDYAEEEDDDDNDGPEIKEEDDGEKGIKQEKDDG